MISRYSLRLKNQINSPFLKKSFLLTFTLLCAASFSIGSLITRLFAPKSLPDLILFQSTSVFLAFLFQAGLRAGIRNQYHQGRTKLVTEIENQILWLAPRAALFLTFLFSWQSQFGFCPAFAILHAVSSLFLQLRIAQNKKSMVTWSILIFLSIVIPCLAIAFLPIPFQKTKILIEIFSVIFLFLLNSRKTQNIRSLKILFKLTQSSFGIHLGSFSLYFLNFCLSQYVLMLSKTNLQMAIVFADVQIVCGIQTLLFSRMYVYFESSIVRKGKIGMAFGSTIAWNFIASFFAGLIYYLFHTREESSYYFVFSFFNLGGISLGMLSQFISKKYRIESLLCPLFAGVLLALGYFYKVERGPLSLLLIAICSPGFISILLFQRYLLKSSSYLIQFNPLRKAEYVR